MLNVSENSYSVGTIQRKSRKTLNGRRGLNSAPLIYQFESSAVWTLWGQNDLENMGVFSGRNLLMCKAFYRKSTK